MFGSCAICGKKFGISPEYKSSKDWNLKGNLCKNCFQNPDIPDESIENTNANACHICKKNISRHNFTKLSMCHGCFKSYFGKILKWKPFAEYYGGHKAILAGGKFSEFEGCMLYLCETHVIAQKYDNNPSKRWEMLIPLKNVQIGGWEIKENERRVSTTGGGIGGMSPPFGAGLFSATSHKEGKSHRIVIPYIDENGIPQEPVFGISSFGGKEIREWANSIYNQIVKVKQEQPPELQQSTTNSDDPLKILKIRYAKGEITKEEFEQMKKDLDNS